MDDDKGDEGEGQEEELFLNDLVVPHCRHSGPLSRALLSQRISEFFKEEGWEVRREGGTTGPAHGFDLLLRKGSRGAAVTVVTGTAVRDINEAVAHIRELQSDIPQIKPYLGVDCTRFSRLFRGATGEATVTCIDQLGAGVVIVSPDAILLLETIDDVDWYDKDFSHCFGCPSCEGFALDPYGYLLLRYGLAHAIRALGADEFKDLTGLDLSITVEDAESDLVGEDEEDEGE